MPFEFSLGRLDEPLKLDKLPGVIVLLSRSSTLLPQFLQALAQHFDSLCGLAIHEAPNDVCIARAKPTGEVKSTINGPEMLPDHIDALVRFSRTYSSSEMRE
jgi:hypothetical protein